MLVFFKAVFLSSNIVALYSVVDFSHCDNILVPIAKMTIMNRHAI